MPRIGLVHALHASMAPTEAIFDAEWPEAETVNLYDQSLYVDYDHCGAATKEIEQRVAQLLLYSQECGAQAILFTGSLFGEAVEKARIAMQVPVLSAYEAMIEDAVKQGAHLALLATLQDTIDMISGDIQSYAGNHGIRYQLDAQLVPGAMHSLLTGERVSHDRAVLTQANLMRDYDALMLGQFSMAPVVQDIIDRPGRRVLTSPGCAVAKLKRLI